MIKSWLNTSTATENFYDKINIGSNLCDIGHSNFFLGISLEAREPKQK